jgi:hypothetical protein
MGRAFTPGPARRREQRRLDVPGLLCLVATLLLLSSGVRIARADDPDATRMSIDPALAERPAEGWFAPGAEHEVDWSAALEAERAAIAAERAAPGIGPDDAQIEWPPGLAGVEIEPGVILLNTRGYNAPLPAGGGGSPTRAGAPTDDVSADPEAMPTPPEAARTPSMLGPASLGPSR